MPREGRRAGREECREGGGDNGAWNWTSADSRSLGGFAVRRECLSHGGAVGGRLAAREKCTGKTEQARVQAAARRAGRRSDQITVLLTAFSQGNQKFWKWRHKKRGRITGVSVGIAHDWRFLRVAALPARHGGRSEP